MARQRSPDRDKAKEIYLDSKGKIKLIDIAAELGLKDTQIRKWKSQDKWDDELKGTLPKKKSNVTKTNPIKKNVDRVVDAVRTENNELTDKQRLFCIYYVKYFNASKAARKAGYSESYAVVDVYKLLENPRVRDEIDRLKSSKFKGAFLDKEDLLQKYIDIAFADITDYVEFGQEEVKVMGAFGPVIDEEGKQVTKIINVVKFKQSDEVDGTIISEIGQGKDGAKLKLQDKMKALDFLAKHIGLLDIETQHKLKIEEQKLEIAKIKAGDVEPDEVEDDGFIEALKSQVGEVWSDEDTE